MKKEKEITLELANSIPDLIKLQEYTLRDMRRLGINQPKVLDFQEDILKVLKAVNEMDIINLDNN